jgi:hypothetical protein
MFECGRGVADPYALPRLRLQRSFVEEALLANLPYLD